MNNARLRYYNELYHPTLQRKNTLLQRFMALIYYIFSLDSVTAVYVTYGVR